MNTDAVSFSAPSERSDVDASSEGQALHCAPARLVRAAAADAGVARPSWCAIEAAPLPLSVRVRCGVYGVVLLLALIGTGLCIPIVSTRRYMTITQFMNATSAVVVRPVAVLTPMGARHSHWCSAVVGTVEAALDPRGNRYCRTLCVRPTEGVWTAAVAGILCFALSLLLAVLAAALLVVLFHPWRRDEPPRGAAPGVDVAALQRASDGPPSGVEVRLRRWLSIAAFVVSILCCSVTAVTLTAGLWEETAVAKAVRAATAQHPRVLRANYSGALWSELVWPTLPNLVVFLLCTALLAVPSLSGIADKPAPQPTARSQLEAALLGDEQSMKSSGPAASQEARL
ncbi:hypothetical protein STCU_12091 [Strigomonas culicis]|uniref:Uncharacterized protein n=1 Tax=Strigomonas culicis TaxID=28005 RepID=S9UXT0_9TRYP|nr:hypothetical protein STCU_12091 [Strigomonas culicis]|eukprot:EPY15355.1 hypothetical protein STCU_12091 [Strigomonas culicis]